MMDPYAELVRDAGTPVLDPLSRTAATNLRTAMTLRETAWQLAEAGLRAFRPELDEAAVQAEVRALFRRATG
jgi:hypothetical protein